MPDPGDELEELRTLAAQVRAEKVEWEVPPAGLWDRIATEAGLDPITAAAPPTPRADTDGAGTAGRSDVSLDQTSGATPAGPPTVSADIRPTGSDVGPPAVSATINPAGPPATGDRAGPYDTVHVDAELTDPGAGATATVRPIGSARSRRGVPRWLLAAAAVVVVLGLGGLALRLTAGADDPDVLAASPLARLGDTGEGRAELIEKDGSLQLRIEASGVEPGDEDFLEVWVIDSEVSKLISLGPVRGDGLYDLPASYDAAEYPIVDVSIEPNDGDPTHSGNSVLRGELSS